MGKIGKTKYSRVPRLVVFSLSFRGPSSKTEQASSSSSSDLSPDVVSRLKLTKEVVPGSMGAAFVLVATNESPLSILATIDVTAKNAVVSVQGEEIGRGAEVELSNMSFLCPKGRKKILFRIAYHELSCGLKWTYKAHLTIDSDPKAVNASFLYTIPVLRGVLSQGNCQGSHVGKALVF